MNVQKHSILSFIWLTVISMMPLLWGVFTVGVQLPFLFASQYYLQIRMLIRTVLMLAIIWFLFGKKLSYAQKKIQALIFNYVIPLPSYQLLSALMLLGIITGFLFVPLWKYPLALSLIQGVLLSSFIEELVTHSIFVSYRLSVPAFIWFNILTSVTFALMHFWYAPDQHCFELITCGHVEFSFVLGIIAYKTKRIELPMLLHLFSNLLWPIFNLVLKQPIPPYVHTIKFYIAILLLIGCSHQLKQEKMLQ